MGRYTESGAGTLHWVDHGGSGPTIVLIHGLGGSTVDWEAVAEDLTTLGRVVAPDLPSFGLSPPGRGKGLDSMTNALVAFISEPGHPVVLVGNSMGALVAIMTAARRPDIVKAMVLVSPAFPPRPWDPDIHWPTTIRLALQTAPVIGEIVSRWLWHRHSAWERVSLTLGWVTHKPGRVPMPVVESFVRLSEQRSHLPWAVGAVPAASRSIAALWARRSRLVAAIRQVAAPTLVVQGVADRLIPKSAVEAVCRLRPDWDLRHMSDTGHTPHLDAPRRFLEVVGPWLEDRLG